MYYLHFLYSSALASYGLIHFTLCSYTCARLYFVFVTQSAAPVEIENSEKCHNVYKRIAFKAHFGTCCELLAYSVGVHMRCMPEL
jgi:hypothetical protein